MTTQPKTHEQNSQEKPELFCLSIDMDSGEIDVLPVTTPAERVNFGCYIPHHTGSRQQMEALRERIITSRFNRIRKIKV